MHELSITQSMLDLVLEHAEKAEARRVEKVNLVIGEMTGVVDECVQFYFSLLGKGTIAEKAVLSCKMVPVAAQCRSCGKTFQPKNYDWTCPYCGNHGVEIVAGQELFVESIEVE
jgi:hydrogenase nickel incorporation protein HypA/HybF